MYFNFCNFQALLVKNNVTMILYKNNKYNNFLYVIYVIKINSIFKYAYGYLNVLIYKALK